MYCLNTRTRALKNLRKGYEKALWYSLNQFMYSTFFLLAEQPPSGPGRPVSRGFYDGWNFNSGNYLFTTDTK